MKVIKDFAVELSGLTSLLDKRENVNFIDLITPSLIAQPLLQVLEVTQ